MIDVLSDLRSYEYSCESYEEDNYGEIQAGYIAKEILQQTMYECLYFRDIADYLEEMINKRKYSNIEMAHRLKVYFDKKYETFCRNSQKSLQTKKKATMLKLAAFDSVRYVLIDVLESNDYKIS